MAITILKDGKEYEKKMDEFEKNVVDFYNYGKDSLLIDKNGKADGNEMAYLHTL